MTSIRAELNAFKATVKEHKYLKVRSKLGEISLVERSKKSSLKQISSYAKKILLNSEISIDERKELAGYFKTIVKSFEDKKKRSSKFLFLKNWILNLIKKHQISNSEKILENFYTLTLQKTFESSSFKKSEQQAKADLAKASFGEYVVWKKNPQTFEIGYKIPAYPNPMLVTTTIPLNENSQKVIENFEILLKNRLGYTKREEATDLPPPENDSATQNLTSEEIEDIELQSQKNDDGDKTDKGAKKTDLPPPENDSATQNLTPEEIEDTELQSQKNDDNDKTNSKTDLQPPKDTPSFDSANLTSEEIEDAALQSQKNNDDYVANATAHIGQVQIRRIGNSNRFNIEVQMSINNNFSYLLRDLSNEEANALKTEAGFCAFLKNENYLFDSKEEALENFEQSPNGDFLLWQDNQKNRHVILLNGVEKDYLKSYPILKGEDLRIGIQRILTEHQNDHLTT